MELKNILKQHLSSFFSDLNIDYKFSNEIIDKDDNIESEIHSEKYTQIWVNLNSNLKLEFTVMKRIDILGVEKSMMIMMILGKYNNNVLMRFLNLRDYFDKKIKKKIPLLSDFEGDNLQEKLDSFFKWFLENIDYRLIKIFRGEDWVEIPFDWHGYK